MVRMRFAVTLPGGVYNTENLILMKQLGCTDVIGHGPRPSRPDEVWEQGDLEQLRRQVESHGLRLEIFEDGPKINKIVYDLPGREEQLEAFCKSMENLGAAGIRVIKPQHMPPVRNMIWRTRADKPTRGGATSTAFDYDLVRDLPPTEKYGRYREEEIWRNLEHLLKGVDVPSAIRHFGRQGKIFFAHFRNVRGSVHEEGGFQEIFHDDPAGEVDMYEAMKAYYEVGFEGPMRPDHAPKMIGDQAFGGHEGYYMLGKVLALGYMKGLAQSIEADHKRE